MSDTDTSAAEVDVVLASVAALTRLARRTRPDTDVATLLGTVAEVVGAMLPSDRMVVRLGGQVAAVVPPPPVDAPALSGDLAAVVLARGESAFAGHDEGGPAATSALAVPLVCLAEVIGTLEVQREQPHAFTERHRVLLEAVAVQMAGAIESARRYRAMVELETLKSDFITRVSHELRTPITIVSGFVSTLLAGGDGISADQQHEILERVAVATDRLSQLVEELITLSRLESGAIIARVSDVDLAEIATRVASSVPDQVTVAADGACVVATDPALVERALVMLVDNALKYAGSCLLEVGPGCIRVVDHGPGIGSDHRHRVFETFTRASTNTSVPGMGVGLPIARTLLAAAGAELRMEDPADSVGITLLIEFSGR